MNTNQNAFSEDQLTCLTIRLDAIIRLLLLQLPEKLTQSKKIAILSELGFQSKEIAALLGTSRNSVSVTLNQIKKTGEVVNSPADPV